MDADVIVLGAGLAGLRAATRLRAAGTSVVVLEARDRVGGRTETSTIAGVDIDVGGQWLGPTQDRMYDLVADLGLTTFPTFNQGQHLIEIGGRRSRMKSHRGAVPHLHPFALADLAQGIARLQRLAQRVPLDRPWEAAKADHLDGQTFETWIRRNLRTPTGRAYFRVIAEAVFSVQAAELSLLHTLFYIHSGGDLEGLISVDQGAQQDRVVGGSWQVAAGLADRLGDVVQLEQAAIAVDHDAHGVRVTTRAGHVWSGRRLITTLPPTLAGRLVHTPALPGWRDQLTQKLPAGSVIKINVAYDEPFWRADGLTGQAGGDRSPVKVVFDNSPPDGRPGILLAFLEGDDGRRLARVPEAQRRGQVLTALAHWFGPRALTPVDYLERDWMAQEFTRGCYGAHFAPGTWTSFGHALATPIGPLHWAGAETSPVWNGYMEGAVRSGDRVADEVLAALG